MCLCCAHDSAAIYLQIGRITEERPCDRPLTEELLVSLFAARLHVRRVEGVCDEERGPTHTFQHASVQVARDVKQEGMTRGRMPQVDQSKSCFVYMVLRHDITQWRLHLSLVVEVHRIDNLLLSVLHDLPDGASDHVTGWQGSDGQAVSFPCPRIRK